MRLCRTDQSRRAATARLRTFPARRCRSTSNAPPRPWSINRSARWTSARATSTLASSTAGRSSGSPSVAEHDQVSEVYYIIEGTATLVTGADIEGWKRRPADQANVRLLNGPGGDGTSIRDGVTHQLKPGDVMVIPAGVGHQFTKVDNHIRYLMVRVDPDKVTPLKDEAASRADLRGGRQ